MASCSVALTSNDNGVSWKWFLRFRQEMPVKIKEEMESYLQEITSDIIVPTQHSGQRKLLNLIQEKFFNRFGSPSEVENEPIPGTERTL